MPVRANTGLITECIWIKDLDIDSNLIATPSAYVLAAEKVKRGMVFLFW